jgi:pyroglutamyl-peptidase
LPASFILGAKPMTALAGARDIGGRNYDDPMRIFIYGFGPYRQFQENITARVVKALAPRPELRKAVFLVRFRRSQFVGALKRHKPDVVLGMGQSGRKNIEIETRAANRKRVSKAAPARLISKHGRRWLPTTLAVRMGPSIRRSKNAGDYVCNYSMYVIIDYLRRQAPKAKFGFVHIPFDYDAVKAEKVIERMICQLSGRPKNQVGAET